MNVRQRSWRTFTYFYAAHIIYKNKEGVSLKVIIAPVNSGNYVTKELVDIIENLNNKIDNLIEILNNNKIGNKVIYDADTNNIEDSFNDELPIRRRRDIRRDMRY